MRFPLPSKDDFTEAQRRVADNISSGPRGELRGPFLALIHSPELAERVQKLGEYLRFESKFSPSLTELGVLLVARKYKSANVWRSHRALALKSGLDPEIIAAIAAQRRPGKMSEEECHVYDFCNALIRHGNVSDKHFEKVVGCWGQGGAADLIALVGYYIMLSHVYNVSQFPLPDGSVPFQP
jgi:4-carboxymuconolactone decarboxylase